jgi:hypothetical protein
MNQEPNKAHPLRKIFEDGGASVHEDVLAPNGAFGESEMEPNKAGVGDCACGGYFSYWKFHSEEVCGPIQPSGGEPKVTDQPNNRDGLCCFGDGHCNNPQTNRSFWCKEHEAGSRRHIFDDLPPKSWANAGPEPILMAEPKVTDVAPPRRSTWPELVDSLLPITATQEKFDTCRAIVKSMREEIHSLEAELARVRAGGQDTREALVKMHGVIETVCHAFRETLPDIENSYPFSSKNENLPASVRRALALVEDATKKADELLIPPKDTPNGE